MGLGPSGPLHGEPAVGHHRGGRLGEVQALPHGAAWLPIGYLTVVGSLVAFATFTWLIAHWPVTRISFVAVIVPVAALVLGMLVLHERPGGLALLGSLVILGSVITGIVGDHAAER